VKNLPNKQLKEFQDNKTEKNSNRSKVIERYMGSDSFRSAVYNTNKSNLIPNDKITNGSEKVLKESLSLNNETNKSIVRTRKSFDNKKGFYN